MRIVLDCCLESGWAGFLNSAGHEAIDWRMIGNANDADEVIARWAADNGFVLMTEDLDFGAILATTSMSKPSVVQIRARSKLSEDVGGLVLRALEEYSEDLKNGAIVTVDNAAMKVRSLPLT
jgi:predicted nuclease of predicted toxin-antitoxin system